MRQGSAISDSAKTLLICIHSLDFFFVFLKKFLFLDNRESAFRVAVEVMNTKSEKYNLWPHSVPSGCNWEITRTGAHVMMQPNDTIPPLLGVVGPACTGAAMSAAIVLSRDGYPLVSFAATGEPLSNRDTFPNFFRTV